MSFLPCRYLWRFSISRGCIPQFPPQHFGATPTASRGWRCLERSRRKAHDNRYKRSFFPARERCSRHLRTKHPIGTDGTDDAQEEQGVSFSRSRGVIRSMIKLPRGAVKKIESTAIVRIVSPQERPRESAIPPTAACTVAFGIYPKIQKIFSFVENPAPETAAMTPMERALNDKMRKIAAGARLRIRKDGSTAAPISPKRRISEKAHIPE